MAAIESLGIGSGLLTNDLVDSIIEAERAASDFRLDSKQERVDAKISAYGVLQQTLDTLQLETNTLAKRNNVLETTANSSNESALTASTTSLAEVGSYNIEVNNVAKANTLVTKQFASLNDTVGTGTLTFRFGTTTYGPDSGPGVLDGAYLGFAEDTSEPIVNITIDSTNNTLSDIRDEINNANFGVNATIVNDGSGYRLLLTSEDTGEEKSMEIIVASADGLNALAYNISENDPANNMTLTQRGEDAAVVVNGLAITSSDNALDEVIKGVTLNVTETTSQALSLSIARDTSGLAEDIESFITAYNDYKTIYNEAIAYNEEENVGGVLLGDSTLRQVHNKVRTLLSSMVEGLTGSKYTSLASIGIYTDRFDEFRLAFDQSTFQKAMSEDAESVAGLLSTDLTATDSTIQIIAPGFDTNAGSFDIEISQAAEQAKFEGKSISTLDFVSPVTIGGSNDQFDINLNGSDYTVNLTQGTYTTGSDLAQMIQTQINSAASGSVTVEYIAADNRFDITSSKFGSSSEISFSNLDATVADTLGITQAGQGEVLGEYFQTLGELSFGAVTVAGSQDITDSGVNFQANQVDFDLIVAGTGVTDGTYAITLDQNFADVLDTDGNIVTDRTKEDVLSYINSELTAVGLGGVVTASLNNSNRLIFSTAPAAGVQSLEIQNVVTAGTDPLGLSGAAGPQSSGYTISAGNTFEMAYGNDLSVVTTGTITVPAGTYETGDDLATAIQTAINADANVIAGAAAAKTSQGSRDLSGAIDFSTDPVSFSFEWNSTVYDIDLTASVVDPITDIRNAVEAATGYVAGVSGVTANLSLSNGLVLETGASGGSEYIDVQVDGLGATTNVGSDVSAGFDFSANNAIFDLVMDGETISVTVDQDASGSAQNVVDAVQLALDSALSGVNGGGTFSAGDIEVKIDGANQIYFETVSKNGIATEETFGAQAQIEVSLVDTTPGQDAASTFLGLAVAAPNINGRDSVGVPLGRYNGFESQSAVSYEEDGNGAGRFAVTFGAGTAVQFTTVSSTAIIELGFHTPDGSENEPDRGKDVQGTIDGVAATGNGQILTAAAGNTKATNGYLLGSSAGHDFTVSAATVDGTNDTYKFVIDGIETDNIMLTNGSYATGNALAHELELQINSDNNIATAGVNVDVQFDPNTGIFGIFSTTLGSDSSVSMSASSAGGDALLGINTSTAGVKGEDAVGSPSDAQGIIVQVTGTDLGSRGQINYIKGIADDLSDILRGLLNSSTGVLPTKLGDLDNELTEIAEQRKQLDERIEVRTAQLKAQFVYNDNIISILNRTEDFLVQQFKGLGGSKD